MKSRGLVLLLLIVCSLGLKHVSAQDKSSGIIVTPSIIRLDLESSKPETTIIYKNTTTSEVELSLAARDFAPLEDARKYLFLDEKESNNYKYSLSSWMDFENPNVSLGPGEEKQIKILIDASNLPPGGHYASIQAEIKQPQSDKQISVRGIISTLLFVRTSTGKEIETAEIKEFKRISPNLFWSDKFAFRFNNSGNVDLTPFGTVEIINPLGKKAGKGIINEGGVVTLPESIRGYDVAVDKKGTTSLPGFYEAKLTVRYGKSEKIVTQSIRYFSFGDIWVTVLLIICTVLAILALVYFGVKLNKRRKLKL